APREQNCCGHCGRGAAKTQAVRQRGQGLEVLAVAATEAVVARVGGATNGSPPRLPLQAAPRRRSLLAASFRLLTEGRRFLCIEWGAGRSALGQAERRGWRSGGGQR